ncbi:spermine/spermidine synthase domain-containing protein [Streptomyces johnsoniae]|uniref:Spermidine synthase n=1 Tax=Streptomyces johnsoniae TaxID=3075532 RepID=A0ABU2S6R4_9ACTN|nr:spermidine synthase [Streptomyces sp. DSM 41886]MDT0444672.1 spermidine synthase [Streptomyces sp. DSM 41886]
MSVRFEEIDWRTTPMGEISLRRRREPVSGAEVYEVKLGDEFLMSSLFTAGEEALARLGLAATPGGEVDVVVGGLGLGYTARTVLAHQRVRSLLVVEALSEVIEWHRRGLVPLGAELTSDPRCRLVQGNFFSMAGAAGFDPGEAERRFHAVLLDIDHAPDHVLHPAHAPFYEPAGLRALAAHLHPGGVFALWSNDPPSEGFRRVLADIFADSAALVITFTNPLQGGTSANTVYLGRTSLD